MTTTPQLSHDQAAILRTIQAVCPTSDSFDWESRLPPELVTESPWHETPDSPFRLALTPAGREALANYDRESVTVRRGDIALAVDGGDASPREQHEAKQRLRAALEAK